MKIKRFNEEQIIRIRPKSFLSLLLNPLGLYARGIEYCNDELLVNARHRRKVMLKSIGAPPATHRGMLGTTVKIQIDVGNNIILKGVNHQNAQDFVSKVHEAWGDIMLGNLRKSAAR